MLDPTQFIFDYGEEVTLKTRSLDTSNRDAVTGWPAASWVESQIMIYVEQMTTKLRDAGGGRVNEVRLTGYVTEFVYLGDQIVIGTETYIIEQRPTQYKKSGVVIYSALKLMQVA